MCQDRIAYFNWKQQKDASALAKEVQVARKSVEDIAVGLLPMNDNFH
jgi:hypothetical protein